MPSGFLRDIVFAPGTNALQTAGPRRRGRPRAQWSEGVMSHARRAAGDPERLQQLLGGDAPAQRAWTEIVQVYCDALNDA